MMAQGPFSSTGSFFVHDRVGNAYPATFLTDANGTPIVDDVLDRGLLDNTYSPERLTLYDKDGNPFVNANHYLVVPSADYMNEIVRRGQDFGDSIRFGDADGPSPVSASAILLSTFAPKLGYGDAQYQGVGTKDKLHEAYLGALARINRKSDPAASYHQIAAFTNAGNFAVGAFYQAAGLSVDDALQVFGAANRRFGGENTSAINGNSPWGFTAIRQGHSVAGAAAPASPLAPNPVSPTPASPVPPTPSLPQWPNFSLPAPMRLVPGGGGVDDSIAPRQLPGAPWPAFGPQPGAGNWASFNRTALRDPLAPPFGTTPASRPGVMPAGPPSIHDALGISALARSPGGGLDDSIAPRQLPGTTWPALGSQPGAGNWASFNRTALPHSASFGAMPAAGLSPALGGAPPPFPSPTSGGLLGWGPMYAPVTQAPGSLFPPLIGGVPMPAWPSSRQESDDNNDDDEE